MKWTDESSYAIIAVELLQVLLSKETRYITYVTLVRSGSGAPTNFSAWFVIDLKFILFPAGGAIHHTQNQQNAH